MTEIDYKRAAEYAAKKVDRRSPHDRRTDDVNLKASFLQLIGDFESLRKHIDDTRKALFNAGYCGEGRLPPLVTRALEEAVSKTKLEFHREQEETMQALFSCWRELPPDATGELPAYIRQLMEVAKNMLAGIEDFCAAETDPYEMILGPAGEARTFLGMDEGEDEDGADNDD